MNLFQKLKERFQQNAAINRIIDDLKDLDEVLLEKRLEMFKEIVTPEFAKIGLTNWNGKYIWHSDFNEFGIKHVVEYNVFKYYGGSFSYGNCFYSVPTISGGKRLINHRTDKSTKIHLFRRLDGWQRMIETNVRHDSDYVSTINEHKFITTLNDILQRNSPKLKVWFESHKTIEQNISSLKNEIETPPFEFDKRIISCEYILSFLYKQQKDIKSAKYWIEKHFDKNLNSLIEKELILKRINS